MGTRPRPRPLSRSRGEEIPTWLPSAAVLASHTIRRARSRRSLRSIEHPNVFIDGFFFPHCVCACVCAIMLYIYMRTATSDVFVAFHPRFFSFVFFFLVLVLQKVVVPPPHTVVFGCNRSALGSGFFREIIIRSLSSRNYFQTQVEDSAFWRGSTSKVRKLALK